MTIQTTYNDILFVSDLSIDRVTYKLNRLFAIPVDLEDTVKPAHLLGFNKSYCYLMTNDLSQDHLNTLCRLLDDDSDDDDPSRTAYTRLFAI